MRNKPYTEYNAQNVLNRLERYIEQGFTRNMREVYDDLSIFDWWVDRLSVAKMKQMRTFLKTAIKNGYTGYVCFKVGASDCANGMWAHKETTTDGYSPRGDVMYRSFSPDYTYWSAKVGDRWFPDIHGEEFCSCKTPRQLEILLKAARNV